MENHFVKTMKACAVACVLIACTLCYAQRLDSSALFRQRKFTEVKLNGVRVRLGDPVQVTAQIGWHMEWPSTQSWSFVHLTPQLAQFPDGNLLATYALDPDTQTNPVFISGFQISRDGGETWGPRFSMIMQHITLTFIPGPNDSLMALPSELIAEKPGDEKDFRGVLLKFEQGGKRMVADLDGFHVVDWPWPVDLIPSTQPKKNWHSGLFFNGNYTKVGRTLLATVYWTKKGQKHPTLSLAASTDGGHTWRYYSTIASPNELSPTARAEKTFEGPNESALLKLADGELLDVFRIGNGLPLRQTYSKDNGRTWTKPVIIAPKSVDPQLVRTANGTIVLATGRPGIDLWVSTDPKVSPGSWQDIDIVARHNQWAPSASYRIGPHDPWGQTSSYTGLIQVAPNRLLLLYDRDPEGAPANPQDLSRLFVMPIEILRN